MPAFLILLPMRDPETAFVGEVTDGARFLGDLRAHGVEGVGPASGSEVFKDLATVWEMHESAAGFVFKVAVAKLHEAWILIAPRPAECLEPPEGLLGGRRIAVVGGEEQRRAGRADAMQLAQGGAAIFAAWDLHQSIEEKERAAERAGECWFVTGQLGGVGVEKSDRFRVAFDDQAARLVDKLFGEIEGSEPPIAELP